MQQYTVFYYESDQDVNSWKSEPKSILVDANDDIHAKKVFESHFPGYILLRVLPKKNTIRRIKYD